MASNLPYLQRLYLEEVEETAVNMDTTYVNIVEFVEILDSNDRYVMKPKLADSHRLLREDTDDNTTTWASSSGSDDSLT